MKGTAVIVGLTLLVGVASRAQTAPEAPPVPIRRAPTELFRSLLAESPEARETFLATRTPEARDLIRRKLEEFAGLQPDEREIRLRAAELQFFLSPLLKAEPEARAAHLATTPAELHPLLQERLAAWDALPPDRRQELQENQAAMAYFVRLQGADPAALTNVLATVPVNQRAEIEARLTRWRAQPEEDRLRQATDFQRFFELTPAERERVLRTLSVTERQQMEQTLAVYNQLPADQRERAVRGFRKFVGMTPGQRGEFLANAAKWESMSPTERETWRRLVERATAPIPMPPARSTFPRLVGTNSVPR